MSEAFSTMWLVGCLQPTELLARVLLWLREKLPFEASNDGPLDESRTRVELPDHLSRAGR